MAEAYTQSQRDVRTFGAQQQRLLDDLNRPDLQNIAQQYLQDAMRYFARKAWFFSEIDNTAVPQWAPNTFYPQGACIRGIALGAAYVFCALQSDPALSDANEPFWPADVFIPPTSGQTGSNASQFPPPMQPFPPGVIQDNEVVWANIAAFQTNTFTQLSTVYNINQYTPPIDYVRPRRIEITTASLRFELIPQSYEQLRDMDVIRPAPITTYPTYWAWFQQQIYLWPYPNGFYPLTLSYRTAPSIPVAASDLNFWTTQAERMVRKYAQASIEREVMHDPDAAQISMQAAMEEQSALRSQNIGDTSIGGIPPSSW